MLRKTLKMETAADLLPAAAEVLPADPMHELCVRTLN